MNEKTTFRKLITDQLAAVVGSKDLGGGLARFEYVEDKSEMVGEFTDYYRDDLLDYEPFANEFDSNEIESIRTFIRFLNTTFDEDVAWSEIQTRANELLTQLTLRCQ